MQGNRIQLVDERDTIPCAMLMYSQEFRLPLHGEDLVQMAGERQEDFRIRQKMKWGLVEHITDICKRFNVDMLLIEAKASGISVAQEIKRINKLANWTVKLVNPGNTDKVARVYSIQPIFANGQIFAPDKEWAEKLISQCEVFPKGKHDDLVDTVSQALRFLRDGGMLMRPEEVAANIRGQVSNKQMKYIYDC
jgi:predicted phage terminase large subunit-like protein